MPSTIRTPRALLGASAAALLGFAAACSDAGVATAPRPATIAAGPRLSLATSEVSTRTFTYKPSDSLDESLGSGHRLTMPAGAVCDPKTSGYGSGTWDSPCTTLRSEIKFTAKMWTDAAGRPQVVFSPDVRFVPGKTVTLRLRDREGSINPRSTIEWCPSSGTACVDESLTDPSLLTYRDASNEYVFRRLKHFSGYHIVFRSDDALDSGY